MLKTYVINLDRASERMAYMRAQLDGQSFAYERIAAVDGSKLKPPIPGFDERGYNLLHGRRFHPGEVGCYLSHMEALRRFLGTDCLHALILEDDGALPADLAAVVEEALTAAEDWDILRLSSVSHGHKFPVRRLPGGHELAVALTREKGSGAYLVNRRCAEVFLRRLDPMRMAWDIAYDTEYLMGLKALLMMPLPVSQTGGPESQIQIHNHLYKLPRWRYLTVFPWRAWVETNRVIHRGFRLLTLKWLYRRS
ncbi:glycosyl transferase family 25 [Hoeflea marina]|uniref:Glycosyl transferase family 25 n=1 Tax=Hoeflea marina TaxID=274592 RepID=A0A317PDS4_9HYPH|nr:glycosyltransferase family 25 protein [Hoeflea marina]PWV97628.1 glycosyl transferase family 25 [Hoeflea marina]